MWSTDVEQLRDRMEHRCGLHAAHWAQPPDLGNHGDAELADAAVPAGLLPIFLFKGTYNTE